MNKSDDLPFHSFCTWRDSWGQWELPWGTSWICIGEDCQSTRAQADRRRTTRMKSPEPCMSVLIWLNEKIWLKSKLTIFLKKKNNFLLFLHGRSQHRRLHKPTYDRFPGLDQPRSWLSHSHSLHCNILFLFHFYLIWDANRLKYLITDFG